MMYADTDFFLALLKSSDWLKQNALEILNLYKKDITASEATFIELMFLSDKYNLDPVNLTASVMALSEEYNPVYLKAAYFIKKGAGVLDAFHAAHADGEIISSDRIYDKLGLRRVKLEEKQD